jgi:hypothetical protein
VAVSLFHNQRRHYRRPRRGLTAMLDVTPMQEGMVADAAERLPVERLV